MSDNVKIDSRWDLIEDSLKETDRIDRPILTYWQDSWRRLKKNKVAVLSMVIIIIIIFSAILIPFFWNFSYSDQTLQFSNLPPNLDIYDLGNENFIYITREYKSIDLTSDGQLLQMSNLVVDDKVNRKYIYSIDDKQLLVDYSLFYKAKLENINLQKLVSKGKNITIGDADYLLKYFGDDVDPTQPITILEAVRILENEIDRYRVTYDGTLVESTASVHNKTYISGSDSLGRDLFIRVVYGARMSLTVGIVAAIINFVIGVFYGGVSGYFGGRVDNIMMRLVDIISSIPMMLYVILIMVILGPGLKSIITAMSLTYWVGMARIVRGQVLSMKEQEFILAAKTIGASTKRILTKHLIPNMMGPIMISVTMQIPSAMFTEAFLSFTGLGISAPQASWGTLANDALRGLTTYPYQMFYPALAMSITILAFNLFSDGLRDALDPKLRK